MLDTGTRPAWEWVPDFASTSGDIAAEVGTQLGLTPDLEQRRVLDAIYAERAPGLPACFEAAVIAPRQNLKTAVLQIAALTDLFVFGDELIVWTAHLFKTAVSAFEGMVRLIDANDDYRRRCRKPRTANGDEAIELLTGQKIEFHARSKGGGRGLTGDKVILDEGLFLAGPDMGALLPTMATRPAAQVRYASSAGLATSDVLRGVRDRGRRGGDPSLAYFEWAAPATPCAAPDCQHGPVGMVQGCALDDRGLWARSNPAFGRRISEDALSQFRRAMPPEEFAREFLGWWDDPAEELQGIPPALWALCVDRAGQINGVPAFAVDVALDRSRSSIGVAGPRADGRVQLEVIETGPGTSWLAARAAQVVARWGGTVTLDGAGPAASLLPDLEAAQVPTTVLPRSEVVQACGSLLDAVKDRKIAHLDDPTLNAAVASARLRAGESYVFTRKGDADISPLYAVTLARWALTSRPAIDVGGAVW